MTPASIVERWMNFYTVVKYRRRKPFRKEYVKPAYNASLFLICAVSDADVRGDRQSRFAFKTFACRNIKRLSRRRTDSVRARAENYRRPFFGFGQSHKICQRRNFAGERIVFDAD